MFSGHVRTTVLINSQQLWLPAQDQAINIALCVGVCGCVEWLHMPTPLDEKLLILDGHSGRKSQCSSGVWPLVG